MARLVILAAGCFGLGVVARAAALYRGTDPLAFALVVTIALGFVVGLAELWGRITRTARLSLELRSLPQPPTPESIEAAPELLRNLLRARLVGAGASSAPAASLTAYLIGALVMLGMLGTFLGLFESLRGAREALSTGGDVDALRQGLAAPMVGLSRAFGTSATGVSTSALLGLALVFTRRDEARLSKELAAFTAGPLLPLTVQGRTLAALESVAVRLEALPETTRAAQQAMVRIEELEAQVLRERQETTEKLVELTQTLVAELRSSMGGLSQTTRTALEATSRATCASLETVSAKVVGSLEEGSRKQLEAMSKLHEESSALLRSSAAEASSALRASVEATQEVLRTTSVETTSSLETLRRTTAEALAEAVQEAGKSLQQAGRETTAALRDISGEVASALRESAGQTTATLREVSGEASTSLRASADQTTVALREVSGEVATALTGTTNQTTVALREVSGEVSTALRETAGLTTTALREASGEVATALTETTNQTTAVLREVSAEVSTALRETTSQATTALREVVGDASSALRDATAATTTTLREAGAEATTALRETAEVTTSLLREVGKEQLEASRHVVESANAAVREGAEQMRALLAKLGDDLRVTAEQVASQVGDEMRSAAGSVQGELRSALDQAARSAAEAIGPIAEQATQRAGEVAEAQLSRWLERMEKDADERQRLEKAIGEQLAAIVEQVGGKVHALAEATKQQSSELLGLSELVREQTADLRNASEQQIASVAEQAQKALEERQLLLLDLDERLGKLRTELASALVERVEAHATELRDTTTATASLAKDAAELLRAGSAEISAAAELLTTAIDRHREASERWLDNVATGAPESGPRAAAEPMVDETLDRTREALENVVEMQREMLEEVRSLRSAAGEST